VQDRCPLGCSHEHALLELAVGTEHGHPAVAAAAQRGNELRLLHERNAPARVVRLGAHGDPDLHLGLREPVPVADTRERRDWVAEEDVEAVLDRVLPAPRPGPRDPVDAEAFVRPSAHPPFDGEPGRLVIDARLLPAGRRVVPGGCTPRPAADVVEAEGSEAAVDGVEVAGAPEVAARPEVVDEQPPARVAHPRDVAGSDAPTEAVARLVEAAL
jgi:hypothetical protein